MSMIRSKKCENLSQKSGYSLRSRLAASFKGNKNVENIVHNNGAVDQKHIRLLEITNHAELSKNPLAKRKKSIGGDGPVMKRTAFSDVTNAIQRLTFPSKNTTNGKIEKTSTEKAKKLIAAKPTKTKVSKKTNGVSTITEDVQEEENATLYMSALEDINEQQQQTQSQPEKVLVKEFEVKKRSCSEPPTVAPLATLNELNESLTYTELVNVENENYTTAAELPLSPVPIFRLPITPAVPPPQINDFDGQTRASFDIHGEPQYAGYIFDYLRSREIMPQYKIQEDFLNKHPFITHHQRALCVDWMVEVQETLELNHETLYLGVKNLDRFLSNPKGTGKNYKTPPLPVLPERLQLYACAALLLAAQYDERLPPHPEDWLQICRYHYTVPELTKMQQQMFCAIDFDLGAPISYRFIRRYTRACNIDIDRLTLGRYILECSLLNSNFSPESESKLASAALWLSICTIAKTETREQRIALWTPDLQHYTSYKADDLIELAVKLNDWIKTVPTAGFDTVYSKYSHRVFRKVALIPQLTKF